MDNMWKEKEREGEQGIQRLHGHVGYRRGEQGRGDEAGAVFMELFGPKTETRYASWLQIPLVGLANGPLGNPFFKYPGELPQRFEDSV